MEGQPVSDSRESIREQLEKGYDAQSSAPEPEKGVLPDAKLGPVSEPTPKETKPDKPRAPDGKFAKPEAPEKPTPADAKPIDPKAAKPPEQSAAQPAPATDQVAKPIEAPKSWDAEHRAIFATADKKLQEYILKRDTDQTAGVQKLKAAYEGKARFADEMVEAIRPYEASIRSEGATPVQAVQSLLNMAWVLRVGTPQQKAALVQNTMRQFGVDPNLVLSNEPVQVDPHVQQTHGTLLALQQKIDALESGLAARHETDVEGAITAFASEKDANGNLLRPHFESVGMEMIPLVEIMRKSNPNLPHAEILRQAYDKAVRLKDDVWEKIQADKQAAEVERSKREAADKIKAAQQASASVTGAPGLSAGATQSTKPIRALLEEGWSGRA